MASEHEEQAPSDTSSTSRPTEHDDKSGQNVPLQVYLKKVLNKYPDDGQLLKEQIQNADDAGATRVVFLYDKTQHSTQTMWSDSLSEFNGPSLFVFYDATLTDQDWENIQNPEQIRILEDRTKIGRFGLGFLSAYHLTDLPSILSGHQIGFFDPHEKYFVHDPHTGTESTGKKGVRWSLNCTETLDKFPDQFGPYVSPLFNCSRTSFEDGLFEGTIFRFPLRNGNTESQLSSVVWDDDRVCGLFKSFQADADISLLFLKNIQSVSFYEKASAEESHKMLFSVEMTAAVGSEGGDLDLQSKRKAFLQTQATIQSKTDSWSMNITTQACHELQSPISTSEYLTVNTLKNDEISKELSDLIGDSDLSLLPWIGVSMLLDVDHSKKGNAGRTFCFLPLPDNPQMCTGLSIHVHGYFGLADNRRSIQWPDDESKHDEAAEWNQLLVNEVFPHAYVRLIEDAIKSGTSADVVYSAWPTISNLNENWETGVKNFLHNIKSKPVLYTSVNGGSWKIPQNVYIEPNQDNLIQKVLEQKGYPVVTLPDHVIDALKWGGIQTQIINAVEVRKAIRGDSLDWMSRQEKMQLLNYILQDKQFHDLQNIHLLPLTDGNFISFSDTNSAAVYIPTAHIPRDIFPNLADRFVADDMPQSLNEAQEYTQLRCLTYKMIPDLLEKVLPIEWVQGSSVVVEWIPGAPGQPEISWLERFWTWLAKQKHTMLFDLRNIPLVPLAMNNGHHQLAKLENNMLIYHQKMSNISEHDDHFMTESMCSYLESLDAVVIRNKLPEYIAQHPYIDNIILSPDTTGVAAVLKACWSNGAIENLEKYPNSLRNDIRCLFSQDVPSDNFKNLLGQLPIFESTDEQYVAVSQCKFALPDSFQAIPVIRFRQRLLVAKDECFNLAVKLGVVTKSKLDLVKCVLDDIQSTTVYSSMESNDIIVWLLQNPEYDDMLRNVSFVPTIAGQRSPTNLFPPDDTHLKSLFKGQPVFPVDDYVHGTLLHCLKRVGLRDASSVTAQELLEIAISLSESKDREVATALLEHITDHSALLFTKVNRKGVEKPLWEFFHDRAWVPCESNRPMSYPESVGWSGRCERLYRPENVALIDQANLLGSVKPLVKVRQVNEEFRHFGWGKVDPNKFSTVKEVVQHLENVAISYQKDTDVQAVTEMVDEVYAFLNQAKTRDLEIIFTSKSTGLVWNGNGFTKSNQIALISGSIDVNLSPYLYILPAPLRKYNRLFNILGVPEKFDEEAVSEVLRCIQEKHQNMEFDISVEEKNTDLKLVCDILAAIASFASPSSNIPDLFVPCREQQGSFGHKLQMVKSHECLYVDDERLLDEYDCGDCKLPVLHEVVPNDIAKCLGMCPLSHSVLQVENTDLGCDKVGPHQSTVNAIKQNLEIYKDGLGILKELIQSADDVGATEVIFLIDWRENAESRNQLLNAGMEMCHGPALWACINTIFTEEDVTNSCSIIPASKKEPLEKVGRFGIGFTSVYHITDVPSVVSGPFIMIFDPRTNHLRTRVNHGQLGIRLDIGKESHRATLQSYPNQFQPFQGIFGCDLSPSSSGFDKTLFRLPLRTQREAADTSQDYLSKAIYNSQEEMTKMVMALKESAASLLLFTQNVTQVSVYTLDANSSPTDKYETLLDISAECVKILPRCIDNQENTVAQRQILKATAERVNNISNSVPESTYVLKVTNRIQVTKRKGKKDQRTKENLFIVSSCMTTGSALGMACSMAGQQAGVLPCGSVAVRLGPGMKGLIPISLARDQYGQPVGSAFNCLPLNIPTGLPFHINGNFLLQPNRCCLWSKSSADSDGKQGDFEAKWNVCLMEEVLSKALANLLHDLQILQEKDFLDARQFQTLWPCIDSTENDFHPLLEAFYKQVCSSTSNQESRLIYNGNRWVSMCDCFFIDESLKAEQEVQNAAIAVLNQMLAPKKWVQIEQSILTSITVSKNDTMVCENTFSLSRFLDEIFFPILNNNDDILPEYRNQIILHLLDLRIRTKQQIQYDEELRRCECIPVTPNGEELVSPDQLVHPLKSIGGLFDEKDGRFPYGEEYRRKERLVSLEELGMATDNLDWDDICEIAESVANSSLSKPVIDEKCATLLKLVDWKLQKFHSPSSEHIKRLQDAPFLPVLDKPPDYPMMWYSSSKSSHMSAVDLFEAKNKYLIGSVRPILDEDCIGTDALTERTLKLLGILQKSIPVENVIRQLRLAIDTTQDTVAPSTAHICNSIYDFLNKTLCPSNAPVIETKYVQFLDELRSLPFVLVGSKFMRCDQLAFSHQRQSGTYLFTFPRDLYGFSNLFKACGVRESFGTRDFINVLSSLKEKYEEGPLSQNDISLVKDILAVLADDYDIEDYRHEIWVPDTTGVLKEISELTYNDIPWESENEDLTYPHESVTPHDVEKLGIKTCRQLELESCSSARGFDNPFGQTEELTNRLKNILREYNHIPDVFKELLQNADDARATEIHFVYDPREHSADKLVGDTWTSIHTLPALCVYNDKIFSSDDLERIQKVGVGQKLSDAITTGRFGIGFNATYHLTDCPTFISNNQQFCVFDPQTQYVPGATREKPGMVYRVDGEDGCNEKFPDMMASYLGDIFKLEGATMFRFPLRSAAMAKESKISSTSYTDSRMEALLNDFESMARESLLFLNHLKKISISKINRRTGELSQKYVIKAFVDTEGETMQEEIAEHLHTYRVRLVSEVPPLNKVYRMELEDNRGRKESWLVSQSIGLHNHDVDFHDDDDLKTNARLAWGGTAALIQMEQPIESSGSNLPNSLPQTRYKAFCSLPLLIYTGLPIHVNGSFDLDQSQRNLVKGEYSDSNSEGSVHTWNSLLLVHVIAPAYANLIEKAGQMLLDSNADHFQSNVSSCQCVYDRLFPRNIDDLDNEWHLLAEATLQFIARNKLEVLPMVKDNGGNIAVTWHSAASNTSKAFFDNLDESLSNTDHASLVRSFLNATDFKLLSSSTEVCNTFQKAGVGAAFVSPQSVLHHMRSPECAAEFTLPCRVEESAFGTVEVFRSVLEFCLEGTENMNEFESTPLCLTNDGMLNLFTATTAVYVTPHLDVLSGQPQSFIHRDLVCVFQKWINTSDDHKKQAFHSCLLKEFTVYELSANLGAQLPQDWQGKNQHIKWTPGIDGHPTEEWVQNLWEFILSMGEEGTEECLHVLRDWPIIPTCQEILVPPSLGHTVLFIDKFADSYSKEEVVGVLRSMGCAEVNVKCMFRKRMPFTEHPLSKLNALLHSHLVVPSNQSLVLGVIRFIKDSQKLQTESLSEEDCYILLRYFQDGCKKFTSDDICTLKTLTIFVRADGQLTSVGNHQHCHIMPTSYKIPDCQQSVWMQAADCLFLKPLPMLDLLCEKMQITPINTEETYLKYVLPNFKLLNVESKLLFMEHIRDLFLKLSAEQNKDDLILALRNTAFIHDKRGILQCANYFFDPQNSVFKAMDDSERLQHRLLPPQFSVDNWAIFLPQIGLNCRVTPALFLDFAKEIEQRTSNRLSNDETIRFAEKSKVLFDQLDRNKDLQNESFLNSIADIKFIPSVQIERKLQEIHPACPDNTAFIAYRGSVPEKRIHLCWSVANILPSWAIPSKKYKVQDTLSETENVLQPRKCLGICTRVTLQQVLSHAQNICDYMAKRNRISKEDGFAPNVRHVFKLVMEKVYKYLNDHLDKNGNEIQHQLAHTPVCLVDQGHVLVKAAQMVQRMDERVKHTLQPYIYEAPREMGKYDRLFKLLGTTDEMTFHQLAKVLAALKTDCNEDVMHPTEWKTAHAAVFSMFTLLKQASANVPHSITELYLPTSDNHLVLSTELYYADAKQIGNLELASIDIKFLVPLKQCGLQIENESKLVELLPTQFRPRDLRSKISEKPCTSNEECEAGDDCQYLQKITEIITSDEIQQVLHRLTRYQNKGTALNNRQKQNIALLKGSVTFKCVRQLNTGYFDVQGNATMIRKKTTPAFLEKREDVHDYILYVEHTDPTQIPYYVLDKIAEKINYVCDSELQPEQMRPLSAAMACHNLDEMNTMLTDIYDIPEYDHQPGGIQPDMARPGVIVPMDIQHLLDNNLNNLFCPGETVAYNQPLDDGMPGIQDTRVVESGAAARAVEGYEVVGKLVYAEIVERLALDSYENSQEHRMLRKYKIDIGIDETITVHGAMLYKFRRPKLPPTENADVPFAASPETDLPPNMQ